MIRLLKKLLGFWRKLFANQEPKRKQSRRHSGDHYGAHYYLGDLLDNLDNCFEALSTFKKGDRDAYDLYRVVGARVCSTDTWHVIDNQLMFSGDAWPSFGCIFMPDNPLDSEYVSTNFVYFRRVKRPVNIQATNNVCYSVGMLVRDQRNPKIFVCEQYYISVAPDGQITHLRECTPRYHTVGHGRHRSSFVRMEWKTPRVLTDIRDYRAKRDNDDNLTIDEVAADLFYCALNSYFLGTESGIRVRVRNGVDTAVFAIDMLRTPYFFADREKVVNDNGRTKRILHIVRAHKRGDKYIKSHFRGLRHFKWNGYDVSISLPEKHAPALSTATLDSYDADDKTLNGKFVGSAEFGKMIEGRLNA